MNNHQQTKLDKMAEAERKQGKTTSRKDILVRTFFELGSLKQAAAFLEMPLPTLRDMIRHDAHLQLRLIPIPPKTELLTDEQYYFSVLDWIAAFAARESKGRAMPMLEKELSKRQK